MIIVSVCFSLLWFELQITSALYSGVFV